MRLSKSILIKQRDMTDCGAACLASISAYYNLKLPVAKIRQLAGTDKKGTNALGLLEAAEKLGFLGNGLKGKIEALPSVPFPCIAHVVIQKTLHHYVVIYKISKDSVKYMDPGSGRMEKKTLADFDDIWSGVVLTLAPDQHFKTGNEKISLLSRLLFLLKPHTSLILQVILGSLLFTLIGLSTAIFVQKIIDSVLPSGNKNLLNLLGSGMLVLIAFQVILSSLKSTFVLKIGQQLDAKLILGYYKHLLNLPQHFFDSMRVGEITSRISDAVKIRVFINQTAINIFINICVLCSSFALMFTYYWKLAVIMLTVIPLYTLVYWIANRLNRKTERKVMENAADLQSQLVESLNAIKTIKSFGMKEYANLKTETRFINLLSSIYQSGLNGIFSGNSSLAISRVFTTILLWVGASYVMSQQVTAGELMSFYAIIGYFTGPVTGLIEANLSIQNARIAADRLFEIMDLNQIDTSNQFNISREDVGDIVFDKVCFRYGTRTQVFENLSMSIPLGKITAIIGESGSGKSTVGGIVKRLYPLQSGKVMLGKYNLNALHQDAIDQLIGIVPQQIDLFTGTIIENIALGELHPDSQRIYQLAEELHMMDFINELPGGFGCYLSENGMNLSGGQRQRLAILRAMYQNPEVLIFDEATSALDAYSESFVLRMMKSLKDQGKTVISVTHRITTIASADNIILLANGTLAAQGTHEDLLNSSAAYQSLWSQQQNFVSLN
ncbi:MAG: ATP-binding cassette subfamily B protein [Cyclobacteriaceae bacterium]|jgi:ABC-type bacteriocin transporter